MSNADDFKDRPVRVSRLPPSHTTQTSVFPYTLLLGTFAQDVSPPPVIWVTPPHFHEDMFSLRDVCSNALSRDGFT